MSIDLVVFLKFAAILLGLVWLSRRAGRNSRDGRSGGDRD